MKFLNLFAATTLAALSASASANTYNYDFTWNGTNLTTNASAAGNFLQSGDTVIASFNAAGNDYWTAQTNDYIWPALFVLDCGTRTGDRSWTFSLDGTVVDSGAALNESSSCVHISQYSQPTHNISFDNLTWTYNFYSSTAASDQLNSIFYENLGSLSPAVYVKKGQEVPEPSALLLLALGLFSMAFTRARK